MPANKDNSTNGRSKQGFAGFSKEKRAAIYAKSQETRKNKAALRKKVELEAKSIRDKVAKLRKEADTLEHKADEIDGRKTSLKNRKQQEATLTQEITDKFGRSVSSQYLKQMIQHAILRNLSVDQLVTPTMAAMDILNDPTSTSNERKDVMKMLQAFESAKPAITEVVETGIGSVQEEIDKLMAKHDEVSPKR